MWFFIHPPPCLPSLGPSLPPSPLLSHSLLWLPCLPVNGRGSRHPLGENCFQSSRVSSTWAQFALRSVSWSGAPGSPPTIIDLAYSSASPVCLPFPTLVFVWINCVKIYCGAESRLPHRPHRLVQGETVEWHLGKKVLLPPQEPPHPKDGGHLPVSHARQFPD